MTVLHSVSRTETTDVSTAVESHELLERSDIVSLHVPLTPVTKHLIGTAELARIKPTATLISTALGPVAGHLRLLTAAARRSNYPLLPTNTDTGLKIYCVICDHILQWCVSHLFRRSGRSSRSRWKFGRPAKSRSRRKTHREKQEILMNLRPSSGTMRGTFTAALAITTLLALPACGPSLDETRSGGEMPTADSQLAEMVPASVRDKGTITVAAAVYAPAVMEPTGGGEITGWDIELTRKAAALLDLDVDFKIIPFDGVIPGLQAGRFDAATGEINVTPDRTEVVTFVTNYVSKDEIIVKADSPIESFDTPADVCGLKIGASLGSSQAATAQSMADECKASGGAPTTVETFQTQAQVNLALSQDRIDASLASSSQAAYTVDQTKGQLKLAKLGFGPEIQSGLALANNSDTAELAAAFQAATNKLIENGELSKVLGDLNGGLGAVKESEVVSASAN